MKKANPSRIVHHAAAFALAAIFLFAGIDKLLHYQGFLNALASYAFVPVAATGWLAPAVILGELWVGAGLLWSRWRRPAALAGAVLMAIFTVAVASNQLAAPGTLCGCWFTFTLAESTGAHVAQNLVFLALALTVWWQQRDADAGDGHGRMAATPTSSPR